MLAFRERPPGDPLVFIGHMGGPLWAHRDDGGWSIPKGEFDPAAEDPAQAARREFSEEIGVPAPAGMLIDLGVHVQPSGKRVVAFAVGAPASLQFVASNNVQMQWPPHSGIIRTFPELDRAAWFTVAIASRKVVSGQVPILRALEAALSP